MKISVFIVLITAFQAMAFDGSSQKRINLDLKAKSIVSVLQYIESRYDYRFFYSDSVVLNRQKIDVYASRATIDYVMQQLLQNTSFSYKKMNEGLVVIVGSPSEAAVYPIKGRVVNNTGEPLVGVSIIEKGTTNGVITGSDGSFSITVKDENAVLVISNVGFRNIEIPVKENNFSEIILTPVDNNLDEIVVVGYGTQRKVNLTGSVATVSTNDIKNRPNTNLLTSIQGQIPGVTIISRPGQTPSINFRGRGNLGTSAPLFVINGVISDQSVFSSLDPNSIESMSFLKDAASSSIYGSRAAYGVVLVTTKGGKKGKMDVSYSGIVGSKSPTYLPKMLQSWQYAQLLNEGYTNRGQQPLYKPEQIELFKNGTNPDNYPNTNWFDLVLDKSVPTTQHSLNFSGGTDKIKFFTGLGYVNDNNFIPGQKNTRYNVNTRVSADVTNWLTFNTDISYIRSQYHRKNGAPSTYTLLFEPSTMVARQSNGEWGSIAGGVRATQNYMNYNPLRALSRKDWQRTNTNNTIINLSADLKPVKGLVITGQGSYSSNDYKDKVYTGLLNNIKDFVTGNEIPGTGNAINKMQMRWAATTRLLYTLTAKYNWSNTVHSFDVLAGTSYEQNKYEELSGSRQNFPGDDLSDMGAGSNAPLDITNGGGMNQFDLNSYFGRINYSFLNRYLLEANIRTDGSSRFYKDNRWGVFPSVSAGWVVSNEAFLQNAQWLNLLKLRASYGTLGNINNVGNYDFFQTYTNNLGYNFNELAVPGLSEAKPANPKLTWERVSITDVGVDIELLNRRLSFTADYYIKNTKDILLAYNVPVEVGIINAPSQNIAKVENRGFEFSLNYNNSVGRLKYNIGGNMAFNKNKIINLGGSDNMITGGGDVIQYIYKVGQPIGAYYGYTTNGLYTQAEIDNGEYYLFGRKPNAGDIKYVPLRANVPYKSEINGDDRTIIGCDVPKFTYGINLGLQYSNFDLLVIGQGISGANVAFENDAYLAFFERGNSREFHLKRWDPANPNPNAVYPRIYGGNTLDDYNRKNFSQFQIFDADYFRLKTITLGYNIPAALLQRASIGDARVFINLENMVTVRADKKMGDFDPEVPTSRSFNIGTKTVSLGLNIRF